MRSDLARLCRSCGLCCDGSLFGVVDLEPREVAVATSRRLRVLPSAKAFEQPCAALASSGAGDDRDCHIYDDRPRSCRRFTCRLYEKHRRDGGPVDECLAAVRRVRALLARIEAPGLTGEESLELTRSMEEDFARAP
jgi:uncharacterized protein